MKLKIERDEYEFWPLRVHRSLMEFQDLASGLGAKRIVCPQSMDHRGEVFGMGDREVFQKALGVDCFACSSIFSTNKSVLRGLHFQIGCHKIVRCVGGDVLDVVVDLRPGSSTYGKHACERLEPDSPMLFVPDGFAHGVMATEPSVLAYFFSARRDVARERRIWALDSELDIHWAAPGAPIVMSEADQKAPMFREYQDQLHECGKHPKGQACPDDLW